MKVGTVKSLLNLGLNLKFFLFVKPSHTLELLISVISWTRKKNYLFPLEIDKHVRVEETIIKKYAKQVIASYGV